jgi:uncharacterized protein
MNILIDIGHPAHVHIFKQLASVLSFNGHNLYFTVREGENETILLAKSNYAFERIGKKKKGSFNKIFGILIFTVKIIKISHRFKPDLFLSHGSMYAGFAAFFLRKPHISLEDSGNMEQIRFYYPFCDAILTPSILPNKLGQKQIRYSGYHELIYLHPFYYKPDESIRELLETTAKEPYAIVRFVSWSASHDIAQSGFDDKYKLELINYLKQRMRVFISAEAELMPDLEPFRIRIPFDKIHDALKYATIYIGEGATMASEAGVLGIPSIYVNSIRRCYNEDQEKYGLVYNFQNSKGVIEKINEILSMPNMKEEWQNRRQIMLADKIDVTSFMVWFIENFPTSAQIMLKNPDYQNNFK